MYKQPRALNERIGYRDIRTLTRVVWSMEIKVDHIVAPCKMLPNSRIKLLLRRSNFYVGSMIKKAAERPL